MEGDFFRDVPVQEACVPQEEPTRLTNGQLSESRGGLEKIPAGERLSAGNGLVWLGDLLRASRHEGAGQPVLAAREGGTEAGRQAGQALDRG